MVDSADHVELTLQSGETILLWRYEFDNFIDAFPEFSDMLQGDESRFPPFVVVFPGPTGTTELRPEDVDKSELTELEADPRLFHFAHLARPFAWMDDPRHDQLQDLIRESTDPNGRAQVELASTQDLLDALFVYGRGARFVDGLFDAYAIELAIVANEIRRRLIGAAGNGF